MSKTTTAAKVKNTKKPSTPPGTRKGTSVTTKPAGTSKERAKKTPATLAGNDQEVGVAKEVAVPAETVKARGAEQLEQATPEIISSLPQEIEKAKNATAMTEQNDECRGEPLTAHQANVAANKQRVREDREARRKSRQQAKEARQKAKASLGDRYHKAAAEVGRLRAEFIAALDEKARLLGVERVGEAVPLRSAEMESLDTEIKAAREYLDSLLARKRQMKTASPELEEINRHINDLRRQRDLARLEKKAAYEEATSG